MALLNEAIILFIALTEGRTIESAVTCEGLPRFLEARLALLLRNYIDYFGYDEFSCSKAREMPDKVSNMLKDLRDCLSEGGDLHSTLDQTAQQLKKPQIDSPPCRGALEVPRLLIEIRARLLALGLFIKVLRSLQNKRRVIVYAMAQVVSNLRLLFSDQEGYILQLPQMQCEILCHLIEKLFNFVCSSERIPSKDRCRSEHC